MWRSIAGAKKGMTDAVLAFTRGSGSWRSVLATLFVNVTISKEGKTFKKDAASWLDAQRTEVLEGDVRLLVTFYFPRRGSDLDNRLKPLLDTLEGVCFANDKQVTDLHAVKRYDKECPRSVVVVETDKDQVQIDPGAEFNYSLKF